MSGPPAFVIPGRPVVIPGHPLVIPGLVPGTNPRPSAANGPRHRAGDDGVGRAGGRTTADILRRPAEPPPHYPAQAA